MVDDVYVDEDYIWNINLEGFVDDKDAKKFIQLKGVKIYMWWLQLVVKVSLHMMSHLVPTIQTNSFNPRSLLALIDKGSSLWRISHSYNLWNTTRFWRWWTNLLPFAITYHSPFLNVVEWVFRHIKSHVRQYDLQNWFPMWAWFPIPMKLVEPIATLVYKIMKLSYHFCEYILIQEYQPLLLLLLLLNKCFVSFTCKQLFMIFVFQRLVSE